MARDHRVGIEAVLEDHRRPGQQRDVDGDEEAMGVEDGQRVNEPVGGRKPPAVDEGEGVRREVPVGQHRAFRAAGGAGGVKDRRQIVRRAGSRLEFRRCGGDLLGEGAVAGDAEALDGDEAEPVRKLPNG